MKTSKKILLGVTTALLFTGCDLLKEDGVVNLTTKPFAKVYVDGKYGQNCTLGLNATKKLKNSLIQFYLI